MQAVELYPIQNSLILRARGVELLVLPVHIEALKELKDTKAFADYFLQTAMVNRAARKLYEAWLKKDNTLWRRVFHSVMNDFNENSAEGDAAVAAK
ncbi:MAG: hypothetical protein H7249_07840 [Chitinophagaceae bacterium]|nr:hypothetical protein [Oligoflexus sp.]